ncbi:MAG TPA: TIM barrel protein [Albitalea sp.]|uniref:sugar phosphate isomerase/epimerase family protein n=1 Tax=Piscinibacter sp. TaxID=1903157 RepID=UPI002ED0782A
MLDVAPPALFDLAAEAGYHNVGIRIHPAVPGAVSYPLSRSTLIEWRRRMADAGVGVHDVEFIPLTPDVHVQEHASMLALAGELGAKRLNVSGDDPVLDRLVERFGTLCDLAAAAAIGVDLEFMRFRIVGTLQQALDVVTRAARPNGRLLIDVLHHFRSGGTADMLANVPAGALGSLQLCDAQREDPTDAGIVSEARDGRLFPGEGALPLGAFLDALPGGIPVGVEVPAARTHPGLTAKQRATAACTATRALLAGWRPVR